ncbi:MAG TPA: hypothetical protein VL309_04480 [Vicinamibacterales bacterium]|nr:hypothetical protein [Vicinamibacterales bacterium]
MKPSNVAVWSLIVAGYAMVNAQQLPHATVECRVTTPNGIVAGASERQEGFHGNAGLSVGPFGLWPDGTVVFKPGGPGFVTRDGALGMKFGWTRGVRGTLKVTGRRLDGTAPPLRLEANDGYGDIGFQASYLIFPTPGCWEVNAQVGEREDSRLTFVTKVVKIGDGPARR